MDHLHGDFLLRSPESLISLCHICLIVSAQSQFSEKISSHRDKNFCPVRLPFSRLYFYKYFTALFGEQREQHSCMSATFSVAFILCSPCSPPAHIQMQKYSAKPTLFRLSFYGRGECKYLLHFAKQNFPLQFVALHLHLIFILLGCIVEKYACGKDYLVKCSDE